MSNKSKLGKAISILSNQGIGPLINRALIYLNLRERPTVVEETEFVFNVLKDEPQKNLMFDVGAHIGGGLAPFANNGWQVFAFEPDSVNRGKLQAAFGSYPNVMIDSRAVSDVDNEELTLYRSTQSTGLSTLSSFHQSHEPVGTVSVTTLTNFYEQNGLMDQTVDFIKIDVEGFDFNVLKGIPWEQNSPRMIVCEFEDLKTVPLGYTTADMALYLHERGYKMIISEWYPIVEYGQAHKWRRFAPYPWTLEDANAWGNIMATKEGALYAKLLSVCGLT